ncbi:flagellar basal-body MS-ring/collar protein FliF [Pragia fontium]|uniref:flagellar basal-body MS-ring/collar protein FliF n=1 Tax=Pragia fontium TaxID=82985 RepID=UPI00064A1445|nr:flagellar basal-body MS-ring/collar protein FliF [Pragia fontium]AKJ41372.1 flagellar MS-ring protein [Pragia fontium]
MLEQFKQKITSLRLTKNQGMMIGIATAALITGIIVFSLWRSTQGYVALFGAQENIPVSQVVEVLGGESISYRIDPNGGQILVPENSLAKARMALAAKGITVMVPSGYELMDKEALLGSSQFIQNVRYKRSLEGELAQSIMALDSISQARVHLGISEASSFVINNKPENSASVIVRLRYGQHLNEEQIGAIIHLVSGSVPGLNPSNVQVIDQDGELLSGSYQSNNPGLASMKSRSDISGRLQAEIEKNVAHILGPLVGTGNYRVSVMPQLDLSKINETQERYIGDPRVSDENVNQENASDDAAQGIPGALSNRPANQANNNATASTSIRSQSQRKYAYDRDIRSINHPGFKLEKMTVAIILNKDAPAVAGWNDEQIAKLNKLVDDAAGIDRQRGDSLTLSMMAFTAPSPIDDVALPWWQDPSIIRWAEMGGIGLLSLLFLFFGMNPLIKRLTRKEENVPALAVRRTGEDGEEEDDESESGKGLELPRASFQGEDNLPPLSSGLETKVEYLQLLAQSETDRVAEVIKQWINSNDRSNTNAKQEQ